MPHLFGVNLLEGARWLNAILFMLTALAIGVGTYACTQKSLLAALASVILFLFSAGMISLYTSLLSEVPFNLFVLTACMLLAWHIRRPNPWVLTASSLMLAFTLLTRWAGSTLILPMVLAILFLRKSGIGARLKECSFFLLLGVSPLFLWLLRNFLVARSCTGRGHNVAVHLIDAPYFRDFAVTLSDFWLSIPSAGNFIKIPLLLVGVGLTLCALRPVIRHEARSSPDFKGILFFLMVIFFLCYIALLIVSISFINADIMFDIRFLSPLLVFSAIFVTAVFWNASAITARRTIWRGYLFFALVITGLNVHRMLPLVTTLHNEGQGFESPKWRGSACIAYVRSLPDNISIYSYFPEAIYFLTGKRSRLVPIAVNVAKRRPNQNFMHELDMLRSDVLHKGAIIIYVDADLAGRPMVSLQDLKDAYGFPVLVQLHDGAVFGVRNNVKTL
jgi:hypothetical protein